MVFGFGMLSSVRQCGGNGVGLCSAQGWDLRAITPWSLACCSHALSETAPFLSEDARPCISSAADKLCCSSFAEPELRMRSFGGLVAANSEQHELLTASEHHV